MRSLDDDHRFFNIFYFEEVEASTMELIEEKQIQAVENASL